MFYHIQAQLPPWAVTEALKFIFPDHDADINLISTETADSFRRDTKDLALLSLWLKELDSPVNYGELKYARTHMINTLKRGHHFFGNIRLYTCLGDVTDFYFGIDFNIRVAPGIRILTVANSNFTIDLVTSKWHIGESLEGSVYQRDNNIPLGIEASAFPPLTQPRMGSKDRLHYLITSLIPEPRFNTKGIEADYIDGAKYHSRFDNVLSEEDLEFLAEEREFLIRGTHNALSI